jgi:hypothetical protein
VSSDGFDVFFGLRLEAAEKRGEDTLGGGRCGGWGGFWFWFVGAEGVTLTSEWVGWSGSCGSGAVPGA